MDAYYFKDQIFDELDGAKCYIVKATECKTDGFSSWAKTFVEMSKMELDHAENLFKMFNEYYKQFDNRPDLRSYMEPFREELVSDYLRYSSQIKYMHEMYNKTT